MSTTDTRDEWIVELEKLIAEQDAQTFELEADLARHERYIEALWAGEVNDDYPKEQ